MSQANLVALYGQDTAATDQVYYGRIASGAYVVANRLYRKFITRKGTLRSDPNVGVDLVEWLQKNDPNNATTLALIAAMRSAAVEDECIADVDIQVVPVQTGPSKALSISVKATLDNGPTFTLVLSVTNVSVELLELNLTGGSGVTPTLASLITPLTTTQYLGKWLSILQNTGVDTTSWQPSDPTYATGYAFSEIFSQQFDLDPVAGFPLIIQGGLLGLAAGAWLQLLGYWNYNTPINEATFAECTMQLSNPTPQDFGSFDPEEVTFEDSATGMTYRNIEAFTLGPSTGPNSVATFTIEAELAGSGSNAGVGDIDTIVSPGMTGVTVGNTTTAAGLDQESDPAYTNRCQLKFASVSPAGPTAAYEYAIETPSLQTDGSDITNVTRVLPLEESDYGDAIIFIAGANGALSSGDVTRAQDTIETWANPLVVNGQVINSTNVAIAVAYTLWLYDTINLTNTQIEALILAALTTAFQGRDIGGDKLTPGTSGFIYQGWIQSIITEAVAPYAFKCTVTLPVADVPLAVIYVPSDPGTSSAQVGVLSAVTPTINQIEA